MTTFYVCEYVPMFFVISFFYSATAALALLFPEIPMALMKQNAVLLFRSSLSQQVPHHYAGVLMELAKTSVYEMLRDDDTSASLTFEDRVNIALQLSKGLEVLKKIPI